MDDLLNGPPPTLFSGNQRDSFFREMEMKERAAQDHYQRERNKRRGVIEEISHRLEERDRELSGMMESCQRTEERCLDALQHEFSKQRDRERRTQERAADRIRRMEMVLDRERRHQDERERKLESNLINLKIQQEKREAHERAMREQEEALQRSTVDVQQQKQQEFQSQIVQLWAAQQISVAQAQRLYQQVCEYQQKEEQHKEEMHQFGDMKDSLLEKEQDLVVAELNSKQLEAKIATLQADLMQEKQRYQQLNQQREKENREREREREQTSATRDILGTGAMQFDVPVVEHPILHEHPPDVVVFPFAEEAAVEIYEEDFRPNFECHMSARVVALIVILVIGCLSIRFSSRGFASSACTGYYLGPLVPPHDGEGGQNVLESDVIPKLSNCLAVHFPSDKDRSIKVMESCLTGPSTLAQHLSVCAGLRSWDLTSIFNIFPLVLWIFPVGAIISIVRHYDIPLVNGHRGVWPVALKRRYFFIFFPTSVTATLYYIALPLTKLVLVYREFYMPSPGNPEGGSFAELIFLSIIPRYIFFLVVWGILIDVLLKLWYSTCIISVFSLLYLHPLHFANPKTWKTIEQHVEAKQYRKHRIAGGIVCAVLFLVYCTAVVLACSWVPTSFLVQF